MKTVSSKQQPWAVQRKEKKLKWFQEWDSWAEWRAEVFGDFPYEHLFKENLSFPQTEIFYEEISFLFFFYFDGSRTTASLILNFLLLLFPNTLWTLKTWGGKQAGIISKIYFGCLKLLFVEGTRKITIQRKFHFVVSFPPNNFPSLFGKGTIWRSECFICCWSQK